MECPRKTEDICERSRPAGLVRRARWAYLGVAIAGLVVSDLTTAAQESRRLDVTLAGDEILLELAFDSANRNAPGIYAAQPGAVVQRLVTFGAMPRWSPDHAQVAFALGSDTWILDCQDGRARTVSGQLFRHSPLHSNAELLAGGIQWHPDGKALVRWQTDLHSEGTLLPAKEVRRSTRPVLIDCVGRTSAPAIWLASNESIGRVSFPASGGPAAFEAYVRTADGLKSEVRLLWVQTLGKEAPVGELRAAGYATLYNPCLSPNGQLLACDAIRADGTTATLVGSWPGMELRELGTTGIQPLASRMLGWSPDGARLLVLRDRGFIDPEIWSVASDGASTYQLRVGLDTAVHGGCWNAAGDGVVLVEGQQQDIEQERQFAVRVWYLDGRVMELDLPEGACVRGIDW